MSSKDDPSDIDPRDLCRPLPFAQLMALDPVSEQQQNTASDSEKVEIFRSRAVPFAPGDTFKTFGGHVFAQSAYAASKTVERELVLHNVTGTYVAPGRLDVPFIYTVRHLRDGKLYCVRAVDVRQDGAICFSCICSFKRNEKGAAFEHQPPALEQRYKSILDAKPPGDHPVSPSVDADWWIQHVNDGDITEREFPGVDVRKVDMMDYNGTENIKQRPENFRQLHFYSIKGAPEYPPTSRTISELKAKEQAGEYDNLYACAHLYASDKNSALLIPRALGNMNISSIASLTCTVIFHQHGEALRMIDWSTSPAQGTTEETHGKWFVQEAWTPRSGENRGIHESWLWSPGGTLLASTLQDSLIRYPTEKL